MRIGPIQIIICARLCDYTRPSTRPKRRRLGLYKSSPRLRSSPAAPPRCAPEEEKKKTRFTRVRARGHGCARGVCAAAGDTHYIRVRCLFIYFFFFFPQTRVLHAFSYARKRGECIVKKNALLFALQYARADNGRDARRFGRVDTARPNDDEVGGTISEPSEHYVCTGLETSTFIFSVYRHTEIIRI